MGINSYTLTDSSTTAVEDKTTLTTNITTYADCSYRLCVQSCAWGMITRMNVSNGVLTVDTRNPYTYAYTITATVVVIAYKS